MAVDKFNYLGFVEEAAVEDQGKLEDTKGRLSRLEVLRRNYRDMARPR